MFFYKDKKYAVAIEKDKVVGYINGGKVIEISLDGLDCRDDDDELDMSERQINSYINYCYFELGKIDTEMREQEKLLRIMEDARKWIKKKLMIMAG